MLCIILALGLVFLVVQQFFEFWNLVKPEEKAKVLIQLVGTVATIFGGIAVFWNIRLTQERLITERFSKAVEQLGDDKIEVRLGGIYALERIAKDSLKDHWTIMEVLTSFVQEKSPLQQDKSNQEEAAINSHQERELQKVTKDVQAALTVVGRRNSGDEAPHERLDLSYTNLSKANLCCANLKEASLQGAHFREADLREADFREAILWFADLREAVLWFANLSRARLYKTDLSKADLWLANLEGASLSGNNLSRAILAHANLREADLSKVNLWRANLREADLWEANLWGANLGEADLWEANLWRANLREVEGLTSAQVKSAKHWEQAAYDEDFRKELGLPPESTGETEETPGELP